MHDTRKLAAVLFVDIVGYTAVMQKNEKLANQWLDIFHPTLKERVSQFRGQVINNYGDGCLCTFESAVDALACAQNVQEVFLSEPGIPVRMGLHSGDVYYKEDNVYGDSVNIASRIESLGVPGSILFSRRIEEHVANQSGFEIQSVGAFEFKNVEGKMEVFALANKGFAIPKREEMKGKLKASTQTAFFKQPVGISLIAILVLLSAYFAFTNRSKIFPAELTDSIAVFPFDVKGSSDLDYLGDGMVDLISTKLDDMPGINSIDPNLIFSKVEDVLQISRKPEEAKKLSASFGANHFILGNIVELDDLIRISATKYDVSGNKLDTKIVEGNKEGQLASIVDRLVKELVAEELESSGQEISSLAALTSDNLESLKAYLKGEQAIRQGKHVDALELFKQATALDSTFAFAWMQSYYMASWNDHSYVGKAIRQWDKYKSSMPKKWQEFHAAISLYNVGDHRAEAAFKKLINKYGENRAFVNGLAEYYFHFNHIRGRSAAEAKPYLQKTLELDPYNQEAFLHLAEIAVLVNDSTITKELLDATKEDSDLFLKVFASDLLLRDTILDEELEKYKAHPTFESRKISYLTAIVKNKPLNFDVVQRLKSGIEIPQDQALAFNSKLGIYMNGGQYEKLHLFLKENSLLQMQPPEVSAELVGDLAYTPFGNFYQYYYDQVKVIEEPKELHAASKYALLLNNLSEAERHKTRLRALFEDEELNNEAKYYYYSLKAFENRIIGENDLSLSYIDSAYMHPTSFWHIQNSSPDKMIMTANIYADKGEFEKAIPYMENLQEGNLFLLHGYSTYKLSQWYDAMNDIQNALIKCDLFLEIWKDCDPEYQPWLEETRLRKERLINKMS